MAHSHSALNVNQNAAFVNLLNNDVVNGYNLNRLFPQSYEEYRGREICYLDRTFAPPMNLIPQTCNIRGESQSLSSSFSTLSSSRSTLSVTPFYPSFQPIQPSIALQRQSNITVMGPYGKIGYRLNSNSHQTPSSSHFSSPSYSNYGGGQSTPRVAHSVTMNVSVAEAAAEAAAAAAAAQAAENHKSKQNIQRANSLSRQQSRKLPGAAARPSNALGSSPVHYGSQLGHDTSVRSQHAFRCSQLGPNATFSDASKEQIHQNLHFERQANLDRSLAQSTLNLASTSEYSGAPCLEASQKRASTQPKRKLANTMINQVHQQPHSSDRSQCNSQSSSFDETPLDLSCPKHNKQPFNRSKPDIFTRLVEPPNLKSHPSLEGQISHQSSSSPSPPFFVHKIQIQKQAMAKLSKPSSSPSPSLANHIVPATTRPHPDVLQQKQSGTSSISPSTSSSSIYQNLIPALIVRDNPITNSNNNNNNKLSQSTSKNSSVSPIRPSLEFIVMANPPAVGVSPARTSSPELICISDDDDSIHEKQDFTGNKEQKQQLNTAAQPIEAIDEQQLLDNNQQFADDNIDPIEGNSRNVNLPESHAQHLTEGEFVPFITNEHHNEPLVVVNGEDLPSVMSYYDAQENVTKHFFLIAKKDERNNIRWMQSRLGNGNAPVKVVPTLDACKRVRVFDETSIVMISDSERDDGPSAPAPEPQTAKRKRGRPGKGESPMKPSISISAQPVGSPLKRLRNLHGKSQI